MNQYDMQTQFGFANSQSGVLPSTLDQVNPAYYPQIAQFIQNKGGRLASVSGLRLYDTLRVDKGVQPLTAFNFFANGVGSSQGLFVAGTQYKKNNIDTSFWIDNGKLAQGYDALIWSMQVLIVLPAANDKTVQTSGNAINLTNDPGAISGEAATDPVKTGNLLRAIQEGYYFEFFLNSTTFEHGTADLFPTMYGSGNQLALAGTVAAPASDGMMSNSLGWAYQFPVLRHLPALTKFGVRLTPQNNFDTTNALPFRIKVVLEGIGIQPVTG
jgi:hypothetical protein